MQITDLQKGNRIIALIVFSLSYFFISLFFVHWLWIFNMSWRFAWYIERIVSGSVIILLALTFMLLLFYFGKRVFEVLFWLSISLLSALSVFWFVFVYFCG